MSRQIDIGKIRKGIAAYNYEQNILLRLLRKKKQFTEREFDQWFKGREYKRRILLKPRGLTGDTFLLGMGINGGNMWAFNLELLQHMMAIGLVDAKTENGLIVYRNMSNGS